MEPRAVPLEANGHRARLRVCVLDSSYEGVESETAGLDADRDPAAYDKAGKYEWSRVQVKKASAVSQVRELSQQGFDVFLNLCDGAYDEQRAGIEVVEALERFGCTYTGADKAFYEPSKLLMKKMAHYYDIATPPWAYVPKVDLADDELALQQVRQATEGLVFPLIVKHYSGYNSVGMGRDCKVQDQQQLLQQVRKFVSQYGGALVEQFVAGREFTVLVAENADDPAQPLAFWPVECLFSNGEDFKHFDLKWKDYESMRWEPLPQDESELGSNLKKASQTAFLALKGRSYGRCDFRVDAQGNVFFLEINPNCGIFYPPHAMGSADYVLSLDPGTDHLAFIDHIVQAALAEKRRRDGAKAYEVLYRPTTGYGLYTTRYVAPGCVVVKHEETDHVLVTQGYARRQFPEGSLHRQWFDAYAYGISEDVWVTWSEDPDKWLPLNHCCDPNCWLEGLDLVARRPIAKGEQVTADYATFNVENMTSFDCGCGAASCRKRVTGSDYLEPFILELYGSHISGFVAMRRARASAIAKPTT